MKTIKDLLIDCGYPVKRKYVSVQYRASRTILNYLTSDCVVAYGLGYAGFIVIYKTVKGYLQSYGFSMQAKETKYPFGSFYLIDINDALNKIKNEPLFVERHMPDEIEIIEQKKRSPLQLVGKFTYQDNNNSSLYEYRVFRYKNKKLKFTQNYGYSNYDYICNIGYFISQYDIAIKNNTIKENTITTELMEEIRQRLIASQL